MELGRSFELLDKLVTRFIHLRSRHLKMKGLRSPTLPVLHHLLHFFLQLLHLAYVFLLGSSLDRHIGLSCLQHYL